MIKKCLSNIYLIWKAALVKWTLFPFQPPAATDPPSPYVPFLENFAKPLTQNKSVCCLILLSHTHTISCYVAVLKCTWDKYYMNILCLIFCVLFYWINSLLFKSTYKWKGRNEKMYCMELVYYIRQNVSRGTKITHTTFTGERIIANIWYYIHVYIILVKCIHVIFFSPLYLVMFAVLEGGAEGCLT